MVHAGVWVEFEQGDPLASGHRRLALRSAALRPQSCCRHRRSDALVGRVLDDEAIDAAASAAAASVTPDRRRSGHRRLPVGEHRDRPASDASRRDRRRQRRGSVARASSDPWLAGLRSRRGSTAAHPRALDRRRHRDRGRPSTARRDSGTGCGAGDAARLAPRITPAPAPRRAAPRASAARAPSCSTVPRSCPA